MGRRKLRRSLLFYLIALTKNLKGGAYCIDFYFRKIYNIYSLRKNFVTDGSFSVAKNGKNMIEEVLKNVRAAEAEAENLIASAHEQASGIRLEAEEGASQTALNAAAQAKALYVNRISEAEKSAAENDEKEDKACALACEKMINDANAAAEDLSARVFSEIINGSC